MAIEKNSVSMTSFSVGLMLVYREANEFSKLIFKPCYLTKKKVLAISQSSLVEGVESLMCNIISSRDNMDDGLSYFSTGISLSLSL